jgi:hypothetical protein
MHAGLETGMPDNADKALGLSGDLTFGFVELVVQTFFQLNEVGRQRHTDRAKLIQLFAQTLMHLMNILGLLDHLFEQQAYPRLDFFQRH